MLILIVSNASNKQMNVGKSDPRSFGEPRGRWGVGKTNKRQKSCKGNLKQATRAKLHGNGLNVQHDHLLTAGNLTVNYDY